MCKHLCFQSFVTTLMIYQIILITNKVHYGIYSNTFFYRWNYKKYSGTQDKSQLLNIWQHNFSHFINSQTVCHMENDGKLFELLRNNYKTIYWMPGPIGLCPVLVPVLTLIVLVKLFYYFVVKTLIYKAYFYFQTLYSI